MNFQKQKTHISRVTQEKGTGAEIGGRRSRPGHFYCQRQELCELLETEHTHFQGIQHHHRILFQTEITLFKTALDRAFTFHTVIPGKE